MIVHEAANRVVRLRIGTEEFALRIPLLDDARLAVDRRSECIAITVASNAALAPRIAACDPASGVLITHWIDEPIWTVEQARQPANIRQIAAALRHLHALPAPGGIRTLDINALICGYWETLCFKSSELPPRLSRLQEVALRRLAQRVEIKSCLCHSDLHAGNLIGYGEKLRLLDWEYSGLSQPLFDLASYSQSNDLAAEQVTLLLDEYGADASSRRHLANEQWLYDWICALWLAVSGTFKKTGGKERFEMLLNRCQQASRHSRTGGAPAAPVVAD